MAATAIARNRYRLPLGYRPGSSVLRGSIPGYTLPSRGPNSVILGAVQTFVVASVPADLSTFIVNTPDGRSITFQFVYNASVQTLGIKIPLPLSGASTAAQVQTAILGVLGLATGTPIAGPTVNYPWLTTAAGATHFELDYTVNGTAVGPGGTQATISVSSVTPPISGTTQILPGRFGRNYCSLPGF